jgi:ribosomal protein S12 methylthiotransferase
MEVQAEISAAANATRVGGTERVVVDRREGQFWVCRSGWDSPEVDTEILVPAREKLAAGDFIEVKITGADEYDLTAEKNRNS